MSSNFAANFPAAHMKKGDIIRSKSPDDHEAHSALKGSATLPDIGT